MAYAQVINDLIQESYITTLQSIAHTLETAQDLTAFLIDHFDHLSPQGQAAQTYLLNRLFQMVIQSIDSTRDHLLTNYEQSQRDPNQPHQL